MAKLVGIPSTFTHEEEKPSLCNLSLWWNFNDFQCVLLGGENELNLKGICLKFFLVKRYKFLSLKGTHDILVVENSIWKLT